MSRRVLRPLFDGTPQIRVQKAAMMAVGDGWSVDVLLVPPARRDGDWEWGEVIEGVAPTRREWRLSRLRWELSRARPTPDFDALHPQYGELDRVLSEGAHRIVHWKNLDGALRASEVAHRHGCAFVLDLHENHPYNMWSTARDSGASGRLYDMGAWFDYERRACEAADAVLVTIDEMGQRLIGMHDTDPAKVVVIHNTEPLGRWQDVQAPDALRERFEGRTVMLYGGGLARHRGLDTLIKAMAVLRDDSSEIDLVIVGDGGALPDLKALAARSGVDDRVQFEGWRSFAELQGYHRIAAFGVVPHHKYGQTDNTAPHKLYQNMASGLPTLVSSCHCLQRLIAESGAGLVFEAGHPESAADAIRRLADPGLRAQLSARALEAVARPPLSWQASEDELRAVYRRLAA
jgi:glycosyltransferase involved in cell wall biosynthesis